MNRTFTSSTFRGEWPPGIHWDPGETRTIPDGWPMPKDPPPVGLEPSSAPPAPQKPKKGDAG